jgi:hypothetical protein
MGGRPRNTPDVIWSKVEQKGTDECWPWKGWVSQGKRNKEPYGRLQINGKSYYAHRVIYALCHPGEIELNAPDIANEHGFVLHTCDNPLCCNPNHLYLGDHDRNMRDKVERGRSNYWGNSVHSPKAKLTADQVRTIRKMHKSGVPFKDIAAFYKVSRSCITHVVYRIHYADVID